MRSTTLWGAWKGENDQWGTHAINNVTEKKITMNAEVPTLANLTGQAWADSFAVEQRTSTGKRVGRGVVVKGITGEQPGAGHSLCG